jgi:FAE1/Type III polyketide synthase-like protein
MLLPNCLFRMGASAVVLTSRRWDYWHAKYRLAAPIVRTITGGTNEAAYKCVYQMEDNEGNTVRRIVVHFFGILDSCTCQNQIGIVLVLLILKLVGPIKRSFRA